MDKTKWPQSWKDQYNMMLIKKVRQKKTSSHWRCPEIHKLKLSEENVFRVLGYYVPINRTIQGIITRFYAKNDARHLILSSKYLHEARKAFPAYYSDSERIVIQLNRYRLSSNLAEFVSWLPFYEDKGKLHLMHLMIGVLCLNEYLSQLRNEKLLKMAMFHLEQGRLKFETESGHLAFSSLIAFGHYMNQNFHNSLESLDRANSNEFHKKFDQLIRRVA